MSVQDVASIKHVEGESMNLVSVVIPAYNSSATIAEAIASVRAQTVKPLEIIVIDDCSKDNTLSVLDQLAGPDLVVLRHPVNKGGAAARNLGISAAKGRYVAFLDADDLWVPHKLAWQLRSLKGKPKDAFVFSTLLSTNEYNEERVLPRRAPRNDETLADYMLKSGHIVQTSTLLVPMTLLRRCRFSENLRRFQDIDFVLQLQEAGAYTICVNEPLVHWRNVGGAPRVSSIQDPAVLTTFMQQHAQILTLPQRLGFAVRSMGPTPGIVGRTRWLGRVLISVCVGALAIPNAISLVLKYSLGIKSYGAVRSRLGFK